MSNSVLLEFVGDARSRGIDYRSNDELVSAIRAGWCNTIVSAVFKLTNTFAVDPVELPVPRASLEITRDDVTRAGVPFDVREVQFNENHDKNRDHYGRQNTAFDKVAVEDIEIAPENVHFHVISGYHVAPPESEVRLLQLVAFDNDLPMARLVERRGPVWRCSHKQCPARTKAIYDNADDDATSDNNASDDDDDDDNVGRLHPLSPHCQLANTLRPMTCSADNGMGWHRGSKTHNVGNVMLWVAGTRADTGKRHVFGPFLSTCMIKKLNLGPKQALCVRTIFSALARELHNVKEVSKAKFNTWVKQPWIAHENIGKGKSMGKGKRESKVHSYGTQDIAAMITKSDNFLLPSRGRPPIKNVGMQSSVETMLAKLNAMREEGHRPHDNAQIDTVMAGRTLYYANLLASLEAPMTWTMVHTLAAMYYESDQWQRPPTFPMIDIHTTIDAFGESHRITIHTANKKIPAADDFLDDDASFSGSDSDSDFGENYTKKKEKQPSSDSDTDTDTDTDMDMDSDESESEMDSEDMEFLDDSSDSSDSDELCSETEDTDTATQPDVKRMRLHSDN